VSMQFIGSIIYFISPHFHFAHNISNHETFGANLLPDVNPATAAANCGAVEERGCH